MVSVFDQRLRGRGFDSRSGHSCVTTLGKLLTPTCLEGSPVSSLKCDRWHRSKFRELLGRCLRRQWNTDCSKPRGLCHGTRAVAGQVAGLPPAHPRAPNGRGWACRRDGPAYWAAVWLGARETKLIIWKLGAILNTVQGSLYLQSRTHTDIYTHTDTQGCAMGPPTWPWRCGLMAHPVSGVSHSVKFTSAYSTLHRV